MHPIRGKWEAGKVVEMKETIVSRVKKIGNGMKILGTVQKQLSPDFIAPHIFHYRLRNHSF